MIVLRSVYGQRVVTCVFEDIVVFLSFLITSLLMSLPLNIFTNIDLFSINVSLDFLSFFVQYLLRLFAHILNTISLSTIGALRNATRFLRVVCLTFYVFFSSSS